MLQRKEKECLLYGLRKVIQKEFQQVLLLHLQYCTKLVHTLVYTALHCFRLKPAPSGALSYIDTYTNNTSQHNCLLCLQQTANYTLLYSALHTYTVLLIVHIQIKQCLLKPGPDILICDEGHLLKNAETERVKAISSIQTRRRVLLTGSPLQNNLTEYYVMVDFVR
jgi:SNF2-related domain